MRKMFIAAAMLPLFAIPALAQTATATTTETFVLAKPTDVLSSNLIGLNISNSAKDNIGEIKDLVISEGALSGYVVSVGGFLGIGTHYVVVSPKSVSVNYSEADKKWSATMDATKDQLKAAPEFKYEGRWAK
ncbi:PRC-barrel domain-containing protein [Labrys sp. KB_33_2]|uniref:PRC-barrel domain-containing protein n=1 Tax=unclassified Labrys (in: a-proteobacteria) TaxID=2688601 RepID=UPI003EBEE602